MRIRARIRNLLCLHSLTRPDWAGAGSLVLTLSISERIMPASALVLLLLTACDDTLFPAPGGSGDGGEVGEGFCGVQNIFANRCVACHSAGGKAGGLDLETAPHLAIVGVSSSLYVSRNLVIAADPDNSFLYAKVTGTQGSSAGSPMPPVAAWTRLKPKSSAGGSRMGPTLRVMMSSPLAMGTTRTAGQLPTRTAWPPSTRTKPVLPVMAPT